MQKKIEKKFLVSQNCLQLTSAMAALNAVSRFHGFRLRREYLSRQVNALRNSFKTLHISKRDFLQRNCLHNDQ